MEVEKNLKKKMFKESFKRAKKDEEMLLIAEEGLDDFNDQLEKLGC